MILIGCASTFQIHDPVYFTTSLIPASVLVECATNLGQSGVIGHLITIDNRKPIQVEALSKIQIYLEPGAHFIQVVSMASLGKSVYSTYGMRNEDKTYQFGKTASIYVDLVPGGSKILRYKAPFLINQSGKLF